MTFLVFAGDNYYPHGGWSDFKDFHPTEEVARASAEAALTTHDWAQVVSLETFEVTLELPGTEKQTPRDGKHYRWIAAK